MKRSRMVELLYNSINSHSDVKSDYHVSIKAIESGLDSLIKAGMLPEPRRMTKNDRHLYKDLSDDAFYEFIEGEMSTTWDSEDESS